MAHEGKKSGLPSALESLNGELMCGVCLELFATPLLLPCGHNFCRRCVANIIDSGSDHLSFSFIAVGPPNSFNCPLCQANINLRRNGIEELPVNRALENIVMLYKNHSPVDIFDHAWNTDMKGEVSQCSEHKLPQEKYCESCSIPVCTQCEKEQHGGQKARHRIGDLQQRAVQHQSEIAGLLTEVKRSDIQLNDRIQLLEDILSGIEGNEEHVTNQLDQHVNAFMANIRQQREELKCSLANEITEIRMPITEELKKCKALKTTIHEMMKKLANIQRTRDIGLRIKLMVDSRRHLDKLLCYEIPWCVQDQEIPEVAMPTWELSTLAVTQEIGRLAWKHHVSEKLFKQTAGVTETDGQYAPDGLEASGTSLSGTDARYQAAKGTSLDTRCQTDQGTSLETSCQAAQGTSLDIRDSSSHGPDDSCDRSLSGERTFDEPDGDLPGVCDTVTSDGGNKPTVTVVIEEHVTAEASKPSQKEEAAQLMEVKADNQSGTSDIQTGAQAATYQSQKSSKTDTSLSLSGKLETQTVPPLDLTNSAVVEKFKKRGERKPVTGSPVKGEKSKDKTKKKSKDKGSSSRNSSRELLGDVETSPRTTSEVLASFVARRRTISPASSVGRSLDVWTGPDTEANGGRDDMFRSSKSDTRLLSLDAGSSPGLYNPNLKHSARTRSFSPSSGSQYTNPRVVLTEQSRNNHVTNSELSPKSFSKQPISVTLDFGTEAAAPLEVRPRVKGQVTQI